MITLFFPNYLSTFNKNIETQPNIITHICKIIHIGPLPPNLGTTPKVLNNNPPVLQNIDTQPKSWTYLKNSKLKTQLFL